MFTIDMTGKVVLVTGAAGNLGRACAAAFEQAGARLVLADQAREALDGAFGEETDDRLHAAVDLTDPTSAAMLVELAVNHFGRIDVVANTVGGFHAGPKVAEDTPEAWSTMLTLNLETAVNLARAVMPAMAAAGGGRIVNVGARPALAGVSGMGAYAASKAGVLRLTETLAAEGKRDGIAVNAVLPSILDTPENREAMPDAKHDRWVAPAALADVIVFLASDRARAISGAGVPVYGDS
jgi:NAD(P)-dependent dehydrogenase (short-subunit alcohol dehydrogenase family)